MSDTPQRRASDGLPFYKQIKPGAWVSYVLQLVIFLVSFTVAVTVVKNDVARNTTTISRVEERSNDHEERIKRLELITAVADSQSIEVKRRLDTIETKIDQLLEESRKR